MKVDDWLAKNENAFVLDSPFSEWLQNSEMSGNANCASSLSSSSTEDDLSLSPLRSILPRIEESSFTTWLANESPNNTSAFQANNRIHEADEAFLNGFNGLNISCNSSIPESSWVRNSKPQNEAKSYVKRYAGFEKC